MLTLCTSSPERVHLQIVLTLFLDVIIIGSFYIEHNIQDGPMDLMIVSLQYPGVSRAVSGRSDESNDNYIIVQLVRSRVFRSRRLPEEATRKLRFAFIGRSLINYVRHTIIMGTYAVCVIL